MIKKNLILTLAIVAFVTVTSSHVNATDENKKAVKTEIKNIHENIKAKLNSATHLTNGEVTAKTDSSLTVSSNGKSTTVNVGSNTKIIRHFWGTSTLGEISVGNKINVWGTWHDDSKTLIDATIIRDLSIMKRKAVVIGTVSSKTTTSLVITSKEKGNQTIFLTGTIKVTNIAEKAISLSDIVNGDRIRVKGTWDKSIKTITDVTEIKDFSK